MNKRILIISGIICVAAFIWLIVPKGRAPQSAEETPATLEAKELYIKAVQLRKNREPLKAKEYYQQIMANYPDAENMASVQKELESLNMDIIFSNIMVPEKTVNHEIVSGDTLGKIAKKYGTTIELLKVSNNLKNNTIRLGHKLRVWTGKFNIFIDKSQNILILKEGNTVVKVYVISTGENNGTPVGTFKIMTKLEDPVWFNRGVVVPPESPQNVLGTRWLGFDIPGYGIHGTIDPETIGQQLTAGCVRMLNEEVEELYSIVPMNTQVVIVD